MYFALILEWLIKAIVLEPEGLSAGWAKLEEIRAGVERFRKSGKPVYAFLRAPSARDYYVALAASRIYLGPQEPLMLKGLRAEMMYFKKTLEKLGVSVDGEHAGKYKDYGDMFTRSDMSPETREVTASLVDDLLRRRLDLEEVVVLPAGLDPVLGAVVVVHRVANLVHQVAGHFDETATFVQIDTARTAGVVVDVITTDD